MVECLDGFARITSKELATTYVVKNGTLQNACSTRPSVGVGLVKKCSYAHGEFDEQPTERSKKNDDKSAVALLKKGDWRGRGPVTTIDQGNLIREVIKSWNEDHLNVDQLKHDNWIVNLKT